MDLSLLEQMVQIPSVFPHEGEFGEFIYRQLHDRGFAVEKQWISADRFNVLAEKGDGARSLLLYGHLDTVPPYGEWDTDPYCLTQRSDRLYGLGANDMKGGIAALLEAAEEASIPHNQKLKMAFCVDEENESLGAYALSEQPFLEDVALILVPEIGDPYTPIPEENIILGIGRRGRVGITISVPGISVHGAKSQDGVNAILEAYTVITALEAMPMRSHPRFGPSNQYIQEISARSGSLSVPDCCDVYLSRLLVPPETPQSVLEEVKQAIEVLYADGTMVPHNGCKAEVTFAERTTPYYVPYETDPEHPYVNMLIQRLQRFGEVCFGYGLSVADENIFGGVNQIPTMTLGPRGKDEHSANEWVSRKSLDRLVLLYRDIIEKLEL